MRNGCNYCSQLLANHGAANYLSLPEPAQIPEVRVAMASNCSDFSPAKGTELLQLHVGSLQKREYSQTSKKIALKVWFMLGEGGGGGGGGGGQHANLARARKNNLNNKRPAPEVRRGKQ